jgi:glyoxylase-like metal-dependent hydrolase (beta-lactamase superfamily II)
MREQYIGMKGKTSMMTQSVEKQIASAKLTAAREHLTADLEVMKGLTSAIESTTITVPDKPVATFPFQINLGGITAVLEHRPGHTRTDLVVRVPERNVMFTGDLLFNGMYPVAFDANMTAWRAELDRMIADKNMTYVPGHGQVSKAADVRAFADVFDDLRAHAEKSKKAGVPAAEAAHTYVVPDRFKNLFIFAWGFTIAAAIEKYYQELK